MYHPADDALGLVTGGVERLRINANGSVGIGTTSPGSLLHVQGTSQAVHVIPSGNIGIGTSTPETGYSLHTIGFSIFQPLVAVFEDRIISSQNIRYVDGTTGLATNTSPLSLSTTDANTWRVRRITQTTNSLNNIALVVSDVSNTYFTLTRGVYHVYAEAVGLGCGRHQIAIVDGTAATAPMTGVTPIIPGSTEYSHPISASTIRDVLNGTDTTTFLPSSSKSTLSGIITVSAASSRYRLQHFTNQSSSFGVFGIPSVSSAADLHARLVITRYQ
jgi:hypothetical protein